MRLSIMKIMVLSWSTSVEKEIEALSLLSFSLIFIFIFLSFLFFLFFSLSYLFFLFGLSLFFSFCKVRSLIPTCGGIIVFIILSSLGQCSNNEDHHTFMDLQLKARTRYDSIWMPPAVYRDMQWIKSDMYENSEGGLATNTMSTTWSCKKQYDKSNACHMNGTVESCMAIYLGMAMEMP